MKKIIFLITVLVLFSCKKESQESFGKSETTTQETVSEESAVNIAKSPETLGKEIFEGRGNCISCHQVDKKLIGPSLQDIAKIYKEKSGNIVAFLKEEAKPLVDPSQYEVMKTNFAITEEMSDEELKALEAYIYSNLK